MGTVIFRPFLTDCHSQCVLFNACWHKQANCGHCWSGIPRWVGGGGVKKWVTVLFYGLSQKRSRTPGRVQTATGVGRRANTLLFVTVLDHQGPEGNAWAFRLSAVKPWTRHFRSALAFFGAQKGEMKSAYRAERIKEWLKRAFHLHLNVQLSTAATTDIQTKMAVFLRAISDSSWNLTSQLAASETVCLSFLLRLCGTHVHMARYHPPKSEYNGSMAEFRFFPTHVCDCFPPRYTRKGQLELVTLTYPWIDPILP